MPGSQHPYLGGARGAQLAPEFQEVLQIQGAQRQVELAQRLVPGEALEVQHLHPQGGPGQLRQRHLQAGV